MMLAELFSEIFIHFIINVSILQLHDGGSSEPALWVHRWSFIVSDAKCRAFGFERFCPTTIFYPPFSRAGDRCACAMVMG